MKLVAVTTLVSIYDRWGRPALDDSIKQPIDRAIIRSAQTFARQRKPGGNVTVEDAFAARVAELDKSLPVIKEAEQKSDESKPIETADVRADLSVFDPS